MINIELELVSDVNLDQALGILARTLVTGRRSHRAAAVTGPGHGGRSLFKNISSMPASISSCSPVGLRAKTTWLTPLAGF